jgi:hypothetical protein
MPTAHHYRDAAARYAAWSEQFRAQATRLATWNVDAVVSGGTVHRIVVEHLASAAAELCTSADAVEALAAECRWRAEVCDEFARAMDEFLAQPTVFTLIETAPVAPYGWVSL